MDWKNGDIPSVRIWKRGAIIMKSDKQTDWIAHFHKALSNPERLKIVEFLANGEQCQCDIFPQIGMSQSTVSSYLTQMVRAGILTFRKDVTRKIYSISNPRIRKLIEDVREIAADMTS